MSLAPGGGKTHLLYHLCAQAVLPSHLNGKQACVIVVDTDGKFAVSRLAAQIQHLLRTRYPDLFNAEGTQENLDDETLTALKHVHIFRPQSLASTVATLDFLPNYLFNSTRHHSFDRQVGFIAIDTASAFYWQDRAETEDAAFLASTAATTGSKPPPPQSGYVNLASSLKSASRTFDCPVIITSWYLSPLPPSNQHSQNSRSFRAQLPALQPDLRLVVHRLPIRKFPRGISVEQALREASDRQKAVEEGKFECFVNEWGLDERTLRGIGGGFGFRIRSEGIVVGEDRASHAD